MIYYVILCNSRELFGHLELNIWLNNLIHTYALLTKLARSRWLDIGQVLILRLIPLFAEWSEYLPEGRKANRVGWVQIIWKYNKKVGNKNYKEITIFLI